MPWSALCQPPQKNPAGLRTRYGKRDRKPGTPCGFASVAENQPVVRVRWRRSEQPVRRCRPMRPTRRSTPPGQPPARPADGHRPELTRTRGGSGHENRPLPGSRWRHPVRGQNRAPWRKSPKLMPCFPNGDQSNRQVGLAHARRSKKYPRTPARRAVVQDRIDGGKSHMVFRTGNEVTEHRHRTASRSVTRIEVIAFPGMGTLTTPSTTRHGSCQTAANVASKHFSEFAAPLRGRNGDFAGFPKM